MKNYFALFFLVLLLFSCTNPSQKENISVQGTLDSPEYDGRTVYLMVEDNSYPGWAKLDSAIIKDEHFSFRLKVEDSQIASLYFPELTEVIFVLEPGTIDIKIPSSLSGIISGTAWNDSLQRFFSGLDNLSAKKKEAKDTLLLLTDEEPEISVPSIHEKNKTAEEYIFSFVKENIRNPMGKYIFKRYLSSFDSENLEEIIRNSSPAFKASPDIQEIINQIEDYKKLYGTFYKDFKVADTSGKEKYLSDYIDRQKPSLLIFWTFHSPVCRKVLSDLSAQYEKQDVTLIAVSTDKDKDEWTKIVKEYKEKNIIHILDNKSEGAKAYALSTLPTVILMDKKGNIIAINMYGENLRRKIHALLD